MRCAKPLAALVALLLLPYPLLSQPADSPWPMFGHDASHTGRGQTAGPAAPTLLWSYRGLLAGSPSIGPAGEIYTRGFSLNDLACLDSAGMLLWTYRCRADVSPWTGAAVAMDGRVHFGSADNNLYCIGSDGALSWSYRTSAPAYTYPSIDSAGRVYFGGWAGRLYCLSSDGSLEWSAVSGGSQYTSPSVGPDGRVYLMLSLNEVRCIYPGGGLAWTFLVSTWASSSSPVVESSGSIYFGTSAPDYHLYRLGSDGSLEWSYDTFTEASPAIGPDGTIYAGSHYQNLYALTPFGALAWSYRAGGRLDDSSPTVDSNGTIYIGGYENRLYAFTSAGSLSWSCTTYNFLAHSALGPEGRLYIPDGGLSVLFAPAPSITPTPTSTPTPTGIPSPTPPPPTATPDCGVVLVTNGTEFGPGDPLTLRIRVSISIWARFDAYLFAVTPIGTWTIGLDGTVLTGIAPVARRIPRLDAPFRMTVLDGFPLPAAIAGWTTLYLVTVHAGHMPPVTDPSQLTMNTHYVITVDRRTIGVR